jgi:hypothetical protein
MYDLGVVSNGHILTRELSSWATIIPSRVNAAVREVSQEFVKDCVAEIDEMIYAQPAGEGYKRTRLLRNSHKASKLAEGVYLVKNTASYAIYQHDGWTDHAGGWHPGRPWMDTALAKNESKYQNIIDKATSDIFG